MFNAKKVVFIVLLQVSFLSITLYSQEVGIIYDKKEADLLYGKVLEKKIINADELKMLLLSTDDKVMFRLEKNNIQFWEIVEVYYIAVTNLLSRINYFTYIVKAKFLNCFIKGMNKL